MVTTLKMTVDEWYKVEDNPIQRDTEKHAARAKHLKEFHPTHAVVHAAQLPNNKLYKLDGHTRALMWRRGDAPKPPFQLIVLVYPVKDKEGVEQLYKDFDSNVALETTKDKVAGAFRRHNFEPQSGLLQAGSITYALKVSWGVLNGLTVSSSSGMGTGDGLKRSGKLKAAAKTADTYAMVREFNYELHALDAFMVGPGKISAGLVAAFILSFRKYGHKITPFWTGVFGNQGTKMDGQMDGIQALSELMLARKGHNGSSAVADVCARSLQAVEGWLVDKMFYRIPTPLDTTAYLAGVGRPAERLIKAADIKKHDSGVAVR